MITKDFTLMEIIKIAEVEQSGALVNYSECPVWYIGEGYYTLKDDEIYYWSDDQTNRNLPITSKRIRIFGTK